MRWWFVMNAGLVLKDREIGHIFVKGPSLMSGYYHNAQATEAAIAADGFLATGDMGYMLDDEIVITGRAKDLILHNGRNIWPQDIEWAAEQVEPLKSVMLRPLPLKARTAMMTWLCWCNAA